MQIPASLSSSWSSEKRVKTDFGSCEWVLAVGQSVLGRINSLLVLSPRIFI